MGKRKIVLGFKEVPKDSLEENNIYIQLVDYKASIGCVALSNEEFKFKLYSILKGEEEISAKEVSTIFALSNNLYLVGAYYREFIDDIVKRNDGEIDFSRLIPQGLEAFMKLERIAQFIETGY